MGDFFSNFSVAKKLNIQNKRLMSSKKEIYPQLKKKSPQKK